MKYSEEIKKAMELLGNHPDTIFIGQSVEYEGTGMYASFEGIDSEKRMEMPVAEYLQSGIANGLALQGLIPVSVYPRWNFLLMSTDQIVNHLDKFSVFFENNKSKVIIRVAVGSEHPVDPQCQHKGNFAQAFKEMLQNVNVVVLDKPEQIVPEYYKALYRVDGVSTILVEFSDLAKD